MLSLSCAPVRALPTQHASRRRCSHRVIAAGGSGDEPSPSGRNLPPALALGGLGAAAALLSADPALALAIHAEPANALSLPTWAVHVSSVTEWVLAMGLIWRYADVSGRPAFKGLTWGMLPCLGSAMCACTWHFFYNSEDLEFLVALQAALTVLGNCTCAWAAFRIWKAAAAERGRA